MGDLKMLRISQGIQDMSTLWSFYALLYFVEFCIIFSSSWQSVTISKTKFEKLTISSGEMSQSSNFEPLKIWKGNYLEWRNVAIQKLRAFKIWKLNYLEGRNIVIQKPGAFKIWIFNYLEWRNVAIQKLRAFRIWKFNNLEWRNIVIHKPRALRIWKFNYHEWRNIII